MGPRGIGLRGIWLLRRLTELMYVQYLDGSLSPQLTILGREPVTCNVSLMFLSSFPLVRGTFYAQYVIKNVLAFKVRKTFP